MYLEVEQPSLLRIIIPADPGFDVLDRASADVELLALGRASEEESADLLHLLVAQFGLSVAGASLAQHVAGVVGLCAENEVGGVHADRHIAAMHNAQIVRDRTLEELVGKAVR